MYLVGPKHSVGLDALPYHMVPEATNDEESKEQGYGTQMANDGGAVLQQPGHKTSSQTIVGSPRSEVGVPDQVDGPMSEGPE